jgi:hypothetical protein
MFKTKKTASTPWHPLIITRKKLNFACAHPNPEITSRHPFLASCMLGGGIAIKRIPFPDCGIRIPHNE